jgi:hypothetical protein
MKEWISGPESVIPKYKRQKKVNFSENPESLGCQEVWGVALMRKQQRLI